MRMSSLKFSAVFFNLAVNIVGYSNFFTRSGIETDLAEKRRDKQCYLDAHIPWCIYTLNQASLSEIPLLEIMSTLCKRAKDISDGIMV